MIRFLITATSPYDLRSLARTCKAFEHKSDQTFRALLNNVYNNSIEKIHYRFHKQSTKFAKPTDQIKTAHEFFELLFQEYPHLESIDLSRPFLDEKSPNPREEIDTWNGGRFQIPSSYFQFGIPKNIKKFKRLKILILPDWFFEPENVYWLPHTQNLEKRTIPKISAIFSNPKPIIYLRRHVEKSIDEFVLGKIEFKSVKFLFDLEV